MATYYSQEYPFGAPTLSGNNLTVDLMLKEPTRINAYLGNIVRARYFADKIFTNGGDVSGGAVVVTPVSKTSGLPTRRSQEVAPGAEFPEVTFDRPEPITKQVKKIGGKFGVTYEARDRNDLSAIQSEGVILGNDIVDQLHVRALSELEASITDTGSDVQVTGTSWKDAAALTFSTTANNLLPFADFAEFRRRQEILGLGIVYNMIVLHPDDFANLEIVTQGHASDYLKAQGFEHVQSTIVTTGSAYVVAQGQVGQVRYEQPLRTVTIPKPENEKDIVQSSVRWVYAVTNPYAVLKVTGLQA